MIAITVFLLAFLLGAAIITALGIVYTEIHK